MKHKRHQKVILEKLIAKMNLIVKYVWMQSMFANQQVTKTIERPQRATMLNDAVRCRWNKENKEEASEKELGDAEWS